MKGKKGQLIFYTFMLGIVLIILALAFAPALKTFIDEARAPTSTTSLGLDCANASISDFDQANCVAVDLFQPYFIGIMIGLAGAIIGARVIFGG